MSKLKDFDGLSLKPEGAADNIEKLLAAAVVLFDTENNKVEGRSIIEFIWNYQSAVLNNMRETGK